MDFSGSHVFFQLFDPNVQRVADSSFRHEVLRMRVSSSVAEEKPVTYGMSHLSDGGQDRWKALLTWARLKTEDLRGHGEQTGPVLQSNTVTPRAAVQRNSNSAHGPHVQTSEASGVGARQGTSERCADQLHDPSPTAADTLLCGVVAVQPQAEFTSRSSHPSIEQQAKAIYRPDGEETPTTASRPVSDDATRRTEKSADTLERMVPQMSSESFKTSCHYPAASIENTSANASTAPPVTTQLHPPPASTGTSQSGKTLEARLVELEAEVRRLGLIEARVERLSRQNKTLAKALAEAAAAVLEDSGQEDG